MRRKKYAVERGSSALDLAQKIGWMRPVAGTGLAQEADVPPPEQTVEGSVFAIQDALAILGVYRGPRDGRWNDAVGEALRAWARDRIVALTFFTPDAGAETVNIGQNAYERLMNDARVVAARPARPWYFWPAIITGSVAGVWLIYQLFRPALQRGRVRRAGARWTAARA